MRKSLSDERKSDFFSWFNLEPDGEPTSSAPGMTCQSFRPSGPAFRPLVRLDVLLDGQENAVEAQLWIDRSFVDGSNALFARDIAASFLRWALQESPDGATGVLIANIADMQAPAQNVILRADAVPPRPAPDRTGGYAVYLGRAESVAIPVGEATLSLQNVQAGDHTRWLKLSVRQGS